jgi:hypothetical protein
VKPVLKQQFAAPATVKKEEKLPAQQKVAPVAVEKCVTPLTLSVPRKMGPAIPEIAIGYEDIYIRFIKGRLIFKPNRDNDTGRVEIPFSSFPNPLDGTFDLSRCEPVGKYVSISSGYRSGQKTENRNKHEVWIVPRFVIEKSLSTTAKHFASVMDKFLSPVGIFWTWGAWDSSKMMEWYDYVTMQSFDQLSNGEDLHKKYQKAKVSGRFGRAFVGGILRWDGIDMPGRHGECTSMVRLQF